ncbi:F-box protein pof7 [Grifola frondosa]|uniref:F-box protein pof7 n=1 Tax=Grifola frondosa TaxID=5627 RepID=A0A1C7MFZ2_GRIFR|nr:F-box protein pof7 [Grifola frondosa]
MQSPPTASKSQDSDELAQFRQAWIEEVKKKKQGDRGVSAATFPLSTSAVPSTQIPEVPGKTDRLTERIGSPPHTRHPFPAPGPPSDIVAGAPIQSLPPDATSTSLSPALGRAIETYRRAVQCESRSDLGEALRLYRTAFRMDANVDRAYHRMELQFRAAATAAAAPADSASVIAQKTHHSRKMSTSSTGMMEEIIREVKAIEIHPTPVPVTRLGANTLASGTIAGLIANWPHDLSFDPEDEREGAPLKRLPDELLVLILRKLDPSAIERFATINRKARVVSLDSSIWKDFVRAIYKPPQIPDDEDIESLVEGYMADYRRTYIEHPRLRFDGVYIAVCHYIRRGVNENAWVNISHLITYHRYLRFYPDGQVLSLLATEELAPQQVIPLLKPTLRMKGLLIGNWYLDGTTVHITDLLDPGGTALRYAFQMRLELRSRPLGRWNRLDFGAYESVELASGEAIPLALKHEQDFFSPNNEPPTMQSFYSASSITTMLILFRVRGAEDILHKVVKYEGGC